MVALGGRVQLLRPRYQTGGPFFIGGRTAWRLWRNVLSLVGQGEGGQKREEATLERSISLVGVGREQRRSK